MNLKNNLIISFIILLCSCSNQLDLKVENKNTDTLVLKILNLPNFKYLFTDEPIIAGDSEFSDLEEIDEQLFNFLQSNSNNEKVCLVYRLDNKTDKYGNIRDTFVQMHSIDLSELRKFQNAKLWSDATCGIKFVKYGECNGIQSNTFRADLKLINSESNISEIQANKFGYKMKIPMGFKDFVVESHYLYYRTHIGYLTCINLNSQQLEWQVDVRNTSSSLDIQIQNGIIYLPINKNKIIALNSKSGQIVRSFALPDEINASEIENIQSYQGHNIIQTENYVIAISDGKIHWKFVDSKSRIRRIKIIGDNFFVESFGKTTRLNPIDGSKIWEHKSELMSRLAYDSKSAYYINPYDKIVCLNQENGNILWNHEVDKKYPEHIVDINYKDGLLYLHGTHTICIDPISKNELWRIDVDAPYHSFTEKYLLFNNSNTFYIVDIKTGTPLNKFSAITEIVGLPITNNGKIYVATFNEEDLFLNEIFYD